jgi:hypothetical protein
MDPHPRFPNGATVERDTRLIRVSKSLIKEPLSSSPVGPLWKEMPIARALYINFRVPSNGALLPGFLYRVPIQKGAPFMEPSFNCLSDFPVNGLRMILNSPCGEWCLSP